MITFVAILATMTYAGGFAYTRERRGVIRAIVWPVALGIALALFAEREMHFIKETSQ